MGAPDILEHLHGIGLTLTAAGDCLLVEPRDAITDEARELIRENKEALLRVLCAPVLPPELDGLIGLVAMVHGFTNDQTREAREIAAGDIVSALTCFRALAKRARMRLDLPTDDRVICSDCGNLIRGQCQAAAKGLMADTYRGYSPVPDVPRNCEHYIEKPVRKPN